MRALYMVMVGALVGCGGPADDPTDGVTSGTRLEISHWELGSTRVLLDGSSRYYDSERDERCAPTSWSDGGVYCTPHGSELRAALEVVYADAACLEPIAYAGSSCDAPTTVARVNDGRALAHLFHVGAARSATQYFRSGGSCFGPYDLASERGDQLFDLGSEIMSSELVAMTRGTPHGSGRIREVDWETSDGSRSIAVVHDQTLDADGYATVAADRASVTIQPYEIQDVTRSQFFRDPECTHQILEVPVEREPPALLVQQRGECEPPAYLARGPEVPTPLYFGYPGGTCTATPRPAGSRFFALGDELVLPVLARGPRDTEDRIEPIYLTGDDISIRSYVSVLDTRRDAECNVVPFADGTLRCLSAAAPVQSHYADPTCQTPIEVAQVWASGSACSGPALPPPLAYDGRREGCSFEISTVFRIGAQHAQVYDLDASGCHPYVSDSTLYEFGDEVPTSDFAEATLVTDEGLIRPGMQ